MKHIDDHTAEPGEAIDWLLWGDLSGHLWNKLIRRSLMRPATFSDAYAPHEDLHAMLEITAAADRVFAIRDPLYTYVQRLGSHLTEDSRHAKKLIPIRDHAREIVSRAPADDARRRALEYFEVRLVAIPVLQMASRA